MKQAQLKINETAGETVESIIELANKAESLWIHMSTEEKRELLDKLLSNRWLDGITAQYEIVKPLRMIAEMKEDQNWRRGLESRRTPRRGLFRATGVSGAEGTHQRQLERFDERVSFHSESRQTYRGKSGLCVVSN